MYIDIGAIHTLIIFYFIIIIFVSVWRIIFFLLVANRVLFRVVYLVLVVLDLEYLYTVILYPLLWAVAGCVRRRKKK